MCPAPLPSLSFLAAISNLPLFSDNHGARNKLALVQYMFDDLEIGSDYQASW